MLTIFLRRQLQDLKQRRRITPFDIAIFLRQFSTLLSTGLPLIQSFEILEKCQEKIALRLLIYTIKREILTGKNIFSSLKQHPKYFDELACQLIKIGEHTGKLDLMLNRVADYQERSMAFSKKIKQTLLYPIVIIVLASVITFNIFIFIVPKFAAFFAENEKTLPLFTQCIFYISIQLQHAMWIILALILIASILIMRYKHLIHLSIIFQRYATKLHFFNHFMRKIVLLNFVRNLSVALQAGLPITEALRLANVSSQLEFSRMINTLHSKLHAGLQLHQGMEAFPYFPQLMIHMIRIGEESGTLELMLEKIAGFFAADIHLVMDHASQLLEPLIMIILGVLIGGLVIGMYLPIFNLGNTI